MKGFMLKTEYDKYLQHSEHCLNKLLDDLSDFIREHLEEIDELDQQEQGIINKYAARIDITTIRSIKNLDDKMKALQSVMSQKPVEEPGTITKLIKRRFNEYELLRKLMLLMLAFPYKIIVKSCRTHYTNAYNDQEETGYRLGDEKDHIRMKDNALNYPLTEDSFEDHEFNIKEFKEIIEKQLDALLNLEK